MHRNVPANNKQLGTVKHSILWSLCVGQRVNSDPAGYYIKAELLGAVGAESGPETKKIHGAELRLVSCFC